MIGGASLKGGSGTIYGAVLGLALLSVVTSSMILLLAVPLDHWMNTRKARK